MICQQMPWALHLLGVTQSSYTVFIHTLGLHVVCVMPHVYAS